MRTRRVLLRLCCGGNRLDDGDDTRPHRYGCKVCAVYGGAGKWEMQKALKEGPEIVVATPGRMIEMIKLKATNMRRCTMMVRRGHSSWDWFVLAGAGWAFGDFAWTEPVDEIGARILFHDTRGVCPLAVSVATGIRLSPCSILPLLSTRIRLVFVRTVSTHVYSPTCTTECVCDEG